MEIERLKINDKNMNVFIIKNKHRDLCERQYAGAALCILSALLLSLLIPASLLYGKTSENADITELSLEELMSIEIITTVSRKNVQLNQVASAVFVISQDDIRRSGATSIPEVLRMVPGMEVSRIDANKWTIGARGFNNYYSNKLLVLMDGRTVYSPLFSGVYWEIQDTVLSDIERIEVIKGPGGTLWGANAVNGIVNIITKNSRDTQGGHLSLIAGTEERTIGEIRYGSNAGEGGSYRVYAKFLKRDNSVDWMENSMPDKMKILRAGGRFDLDLFENTFQIQGDCYGGESGNRAVFTIPEDPWFFISDNVEDKSGWNILTKWSHTFSKDSGSILQLYYQDNERHNPGLSEQENVFDIDFQHGFRLGTRHEIVWGAGYRYSRSRTGGSFNISFNPSDRRDNLYSLFLQDEITLISNILTGTIGAKVEKNSYTGMEFQPSLRFMWSPGKNNNIWAGITRAIRTPSRYEHDVRINSPVDYDIPGWVPYYLAVMGNRDASSEELWAYEAGYRFHPDDSFSVDISLFFNRYDKLVTYEYGDPFFEGTPPYLVVPQITRNNMNGHGYGSELAFDWKPLEHVRLQGSYSYFHLNLKDPFTWDIYSQFQEKASPTHQFSIRPSLNLPGGVEVNLWFRYRDNLAAHYLPEMFNMDARIGWTMSEKMEVSLSGQNLLDSQKPETVVNNTYYTASQLERGLYLKLRWQF